MIRYRQCRNWGLAGLLAAASLRCSSDGGTVNPPSPGSIEMVAGNGQVGPVGQALAQPLVVRVLDESGAPLPGVGVLWAAQGGGSVSADEVTTGSGGEASVQRVLGSEPGEQTTTARATGAQGSPVTFVATATDGVTPSLGMSAQPSGQAQNGVAFPVQPVVQLRNPDGSEEARADVQVSASLVGTTGTLEGGLTRATDADGAAAFTDLAISGPAGSYTLRFTAPGYTQTLSSAITLGTGTGGDVVLLTTAPPVGALDGEVFDPSVQPVVEVKTSGGAAVPGVEVVASLASGSGELEGTLAATTDAQGVARFLDLGIRGTGSHTIEFAAGAAGVTSSPIDVSALPPEATSGKWGPIVDWDIVPLHMNLLPNGRVLAWGKRDVLPDTMGVPRLWNPSAGPPTSAQVIMVDTMLFCAGHALLPDGRLMTSGGHLQDDKGIAVTYFFGQDGSWQRGPNMAHGRWYPTLTVLPNERVITMAGRDENGQVVTTPEIWENNGWVELPGAGSVEIPYYPRNFVDPKTGLVFMAGERIRSRWFDVDGSTANGRGRWISGPLHIYQKNRDYGTAVMYDTGKILYAGGGGDPNWPTPDSRASEPTATAEKIDLNAGSPTWSSAGSMAFARRHTNSTVLPDGQVLVTGGTTGGGFVNIDPALAARNPELWNPATNQWTTLAANQKMRVYHSVSLLLPDGTVLHGSSGDAMAIQPGGAIVEVPPERNHEIFSPPYLFKGARPTITSAPGSVSYGQTFTVQTPNAGQITDARWIRLGSVTHAFDMGQRANTLGFTRTATGVEITAPANANLAPPGYYQLFILNRNGVPSEGTVVRIR